MDNFNVPKKINRNVMKALSVLQATHFITAFVPAQTIVRQVELQMRRSKSLDNLEHYVLKSLCSLTHLGIVVRTGTSEFALRQSLEFNNGVSAIPWKLPPQPDKMPKRTKNLNKQPAKRACNRRSTKGSIVKRKLKKSSTLPKPVRRSLAKVALPGRSSSMQLKQCVVLCSDILAQRKGPDNTSTYGSHNGSETVECCEISSRTTAPRIRATHNLRWHFNAPIPLISSDNSFY